MTKGAYRSVLGGCTQARTGNGVRPLQEVRARVDARFEALSADGYRVLAVAERPMPERSETTPGDEEGMVLLGLIAFQDPPKPGLKATVSALRSQGIRLCMLTGDNHLTAGHVAGSIGVEHPTVLTGADVDSLDDEALGRIAPTVDAFAELTPAHKERIIGRFRANGAVVGYLGDGINDAGPLHLADVGISVDSAVDVAKSAAALVLLDKDLDVVVDGVRLGRQTFANTLKYVYTTISANFGNTASMAAASAFLPFLPMLPRQILLLNFLSDLPSLTIAGDRVDEETIERPRSWDLRQVRNFMVVFGLLSSVFDVLTFVVLIQVFDADATLFRTGWFVGSALTELAVLFVLRTRRLAFRSSPSTALVVTSLVVAVVTALLPFVPAIAEPMGLTALPGAVLVTLVAITTAYVLAAEVTKRVFYRPGRQPTPPTPRAHAPARLRRLEHLAFEYGHRRPRA